jgi:hypothetical protein
MGRVRRVVGVLLATISAMAISATASAYKLTLKNGDRVTGAIIKRQRLADNWQDRFGYGMVHDFGGAATADPKYFHGLVRGAG